eukprot:2225043-Prymnesium_polylepis.1
MAASSAWTLLGPDELNAIAAVLQSFQAASRWLGARGGHVYKLGNLGLGYYRDGMPDTSRDVCTLASTSTLARLSLRPQVLRMWMYHLAAQPDWK